LACANNQLIELDLSRNISLNWLNCEGNQLTALDVSRNRALTDLFCNDNRLIALDLSQNRALTGVDCRQNQLTTLDLSRNIALKYLRCGANQFTADALNALFSTLHSNNFEKILTISDNPGSADCDPTIAEQKGWEVLADTQAFRTIK